MIKRGYKLMSEEHGPIDLVRNANRAEEAGFDFAAISDHYFPWIEEQGHSPFAWSVLGAVAEATGHLALMTAVTCPIMRYHPAIIAQAAATLAEMFPGRFWMAVGSGEALNEHITGNRWPPKPERNERLKECVDVMRALWRGERVTHYGRVTVEDAYLYSRPREAPRLVGAAISEPTAEWVGGWADGLVTTGRPPERMQRMIDAFHRGGGEGKPIIVQHGVSWAPSEADARRNAHEQWRFSALGGDVLWTLRMPSEFTSASQFVTPDDMADTIRISSDAGRHVEWIQEYVQAGVNEVYCFNVGKNQREFIDVFGEHVLPALHR